MLEVVQLVGDDRDDLVRREPDSPNSRLPITDEIVAISLIGQLDTVRADAMKSSRVGQFK